MPPLFMYSRPAKSRMIVRAPPSTARPNASISAGSLPEVTSPTIATTLADGSSVERTSTVVPGSGMVVNPFLAADADLLGRNGHVVMERHVVRQASDPEDLAVVLGQGPRPHLAMVTPGLG